MSALILLVLIVFNFNNIAVCAGGGSCGSCHVILSQELFDAVPPPNDQEKDLLQNVVYGVTPT